jgi:predicted nucleic acid-binding protein
VAWVVDTCVIIDLVDNDATFGNASAAALKAQLDDGLLICPVTTVELSPAFQADFRVQEAFLTRAGIGYSEPFLPIDAENGHAAWNAYVQRRRTEGTPRRPVADILIGGFAMRFQGLITRNVDDFGKLFPRLKLIEPKA